jgi:hypothetical protein
MAATIRLRTDASPDRPTDQQWSNRCNLAPWKLALRAPLLRERSASAKVERPGR